jgi:hypothetical protein
VTTPSGRAPATSSRRRAPRRAARQ